MWPGMSPVFTVRGEGSSRSCSSAAGPTRHSSLASVRVELARRGVEGDGIEGLDAGDVDGQGRASAVVAVKSTMPIEVVGLNEAS